ncbi:hypothetical protein LTR56_014381 [Elasticomyces elasticus]|nr:hypothetical protein LTR22_023897 [Elasticomyces elasticus]KAK3636005.1 hypothetical protein LTR56_014381 [Elasticomyces elasticus]KAK4916648.1 hypothetical protein LTR49_015346 [Elasticomyces elasticus]KAK5754922.1 hypothetical protein LTS12_014955 [Elasticomyces elasticus]
MATTSLPDILSSFTTATNAAIQGLPAAALLTPPENGITLLDAKNEIFLAYLQALALRNLNVIRSIKHGNDASATQALSHDLTKKLVEHRVYLERGVKPLEAKIKYQVDKVVKAADDEERTVAQKAKAAAATNGRTAADAESDEDDSEDDSDASDDAEADALAYRPSRAAFSKPATTGAGPRDTKERRPGRSGIMDEYISTEMSGAPLAEPSIGSNVTEGGRRTKDTKQLAKEAEKRNYEETNLVRLPKESKKDRLKKGGGGRERGGGFGGEEWRGLGESADRIGDLTKRSGRPGALEKSRKRPVQDRPRDSGIGDAFDVKRRRLEKKTRR